MIWGQLGPNYRLRYNINIILNVCTLNILPIFKIIVIYSRQKPSIMQWEIHIDQCNQTRAEDTTQLSKTWVLQTSKDKHQEVLWVVVFGPK